MKSVRVRAAAASASASVAALALAGAGAGFASADPGSGGSGGSLGSGDSLSSITGSGSDGSGSAASTALSGIRNAWQQFVDAGVQVTVDTGSLGVWDTGSLGLEHNAPGMETSFDDNGRLVVTRTAPSGIATILQCTTALVDARVLPSIADDPIGAITNGGDGVSILLPPNLLRPATVRTLRAVDPGVYVLATACLPQGDTDIAAEVMVVPDTGMGSVEESMNFGSDAGSFALDRALDALGLGSTSDSLGSSGDSVDPSSLGSGEGSSSTSSGSGS